ncbi:hypothetical protein [Aquipuribacter sp. MA13-13]|uniref:hypothetical protein n=2 Tax=unclassified Aquipuribacter TaxID=2635084 RepID=UPI003EEFBB73
MSSPGSSSPHPASRNDRLMVLPFPQPGPLVRHAYRELHLAGHGTRQHVAALGDVTQLARPWDPATCTHPLLRRQVWAWLEEVVSWLNHEYVWDADAGILPCWPQHPHLVHEIAVLTDQRYRAAQAFTSDALEDWHRYSLPAFHDRARTRTHGHCHDGHEPWPATARHTRHTAPATRTHRERTYDHDAPAESAHDPQSTGRLGVVDLATGELQ